MMVDTAEPPMALIAQGAEAVSSRGVRLHSEGRDQSSLVRWLCVCVQRVWESTFLGRPCIIKERFPKAYR